jgi:2-hydroxychromene-2-carboxylate isomerase
MGWQIEIKSHLVGWRLPEVGMSHAKKFRFYFSFRSPFAGIACYRLRRCALFNEFDIEMIPVWPENIFGGHMDNPTDNLFKVAYIFWDAARQAEEAGLSPAHLRGIASMFELPKNVDYSKKKLGMDMPKEHWAITHHAFLYAQAQGKGWAFCDAVFNRRFNFDGAGSADVMDPDVLGEIAKDVGLDVEALKNAEASGNYDAAQTAFVKMSESDGVFGVPFFTLDHGEQTEAFWGNDRLPFLHKSLTGAKTLPVITASGLTEIQSARK